jgi:hypothetical protein
VAVEDRNAERQVALQALDGAGEHQLGLDVELLGQFTLPLLGQVRRAQHCERGSRPGPAARGRSGRLDGLADADVVGNKKAHRVKRSAIMSGTSW